MNALAGATRADFEVIARWIAKGASVLDLGCGDGQLLRYLRETRAVRGYGVEINHDDVVACVRNGVNVIQLDLETGLSGFEDGSFDCVILSQTLQAMRRTEKVVTEMLRVGREAVVTFPNFGYWANRLAVLAGRMPVSRNLPYQWYETPNIHLCSMADFERYCEEHGIRVRERIVLGRQREVRMLANLRGELAVYRIERGAAS